MKRILLLTFAMMAGIAIAFAEEQPVRSRPKRDKPPLTDEQRAEMETRANETWAALPVESKMRLMRLHRALTGMPPDERRFIHERVERFLNMTTEEREKVTQLRQKWEQMTPEERQKARDAFRKRRQEFEQKWRQEHPDEPPPPFPLRPPKPPPPTPAPRGAEIDKPTKENP
jgi:hypothetical protein